MYMIISSIKKTTMYVVIGLVLVLGITCFVQFKSNQKLKAKYEISTANEKSLLNRIEKNGEEIIEYQATLDVLQHTKDSVIQNLLTQQKNLNIKNKALQAMVSMASQFHIHDTVPIHDTIFKDPDFVMDTCISDKWRTTCLEMKYPNQVCVDASMKSQKDVYVTAKRETIDPPSKCFFIRWFQKKHTVTRVTIHEENPYIESQENVYIRVLDE